MVQLINSELLEYEFTPEEELASKVLPVLTVLRLKTLKAQLIKAKSELKIDPTAFTSYIQQEAALSGQIDILSQLIVESETAVEELKA